MVTLATRIRAWDKAETELWATWSEIHDDLIASKIVEWSGISLIDTIEIEELTEEGVHVKLWTASYGGDTKDMLIPWEQLNNVVMAEEETE